MMEIAFAVDAITDENGLQAIYDRLRSLYATEQIDPNNIKGAKLVITNLPNLLPEIVTKYPTIFILTEPNGRPLLQNSVNSRRSLTNPLKMARSVVTYSKFAAKEIQKNYGIKALIQLPLAHPSPSLKSHKYILYSSLHKDIQNAFCKQIFRKYTCLEELKKARLYIDMTNEDACFNICLCHAAVYGVPCVVADTGANAELANSGDILLPGKSYKNQWVKAIKVALRDREKNSEKNKKNGSRFRNMSNLDKKIRDLLDKRTTKSPPMSSSLKQRKVKDKLKQMEKIKQAKSWAKGKKTMGRRETVTERNRRAKRFMRKPNPKPPPPQIKSKGAETAQFEIKPTPSWFTSIGAEVSIIVPMFRSRKAITNQIAKWDLTGDNLIKEIIYVDDHCPVNSHEAILPTWETRRQHLAARPIGKIIVSESNRGYGPACNLGAKFAHGKFLVFLNADTEVLPNWVRPMYDLIQTDPKIGMVGNLQLKPVGTKQFVDSAGSEFMWSGGHFEHIGRSVYNGSRIKDPFSIDRLPRDLAEVGQREMVTGCCFMIRKELFLKVGGYDEVYKIGYWEDSDMNMVIRRLGYKIMYQPQSRIIHTGGHSRCAGHGNAKQNRERFYFRWVNTGFVDKVAANRRPESKPTPNKSDLKSCVKGEVVGCVIACNEQEFLDASVRSVAPIVDRFIFVVGGNHYAYKAGMCNVNGYPNDATLEIARKLGKEFNGVVIEPPGRLWRDKTEMRNAYAKHLKPRNWMFMLDGDEVYKEGHLWVLAKMMEKYECFRIQYYLFWNNVETLGVGSWETYPQERIVKWKKGYRYKAPNHLAVSDATGKEIVNRVPTYAGNEKFFYHYSWVRPIEKIQQKMDYYQYQLKEEWGHKNILRNYVDDVFLKWREDPDSVKETHPRGGGSTAPFGGIHPHEVTQLIQTGKLNF